MANATFIAPSGTQTGAFNVPIVFDPAVTGVDKTDIDLRPITVDATQGVDFTISGAGTAWNLAFTLPTQRRGSFEISFTGLVTPQGGSTPEGVMANTVTIVYDTMTVEIRIGFGAVEYRESGVVVLPVNISETVVVPSKTVFSVTHISGDLLTGVEYYVVGEDTAYELVFLIPPDRIGTFEVRSVGDFLKPDGTYESIALTPKLIPYNSYVPYVINDNFAEALTTGIWDTFMEVNTPAVGVGIDDFILEGPNVGTPVLYRARSIDREPPRPAPSADLENPPEQIGDWVLDSTGNSAIQARYFILRFNVPASLNGQQLSITPKVDAFRSPLHF